MQHSVQRGRLRPCGPLVWLVLFAVSTQVLCSPTDPSPELHGAFECPCLTEADPEYSLIATEVAKKGYPVGYGSDCKLHDFKFATEGCDIADPPAYCSSPWCYVNKEKCPVNKAKCLADRGIIGSDVSPYCRERESKPSYLLEDVMASDTPEFSYATCGAVDAYGKVGISARNRGRNLKVAMSMDPFVYPPWTVKTEVDPALPHWKGYTGSFKMTIERGGITCEKVLNVFATVLTK